MGEVTLKVPAEHVELFRLAALREIGIDAGSLHSNAKEAIGRYLGREDASQDELAEHLTGERRRDPDDLSDVRFTKRNLDSDMRLLDQLYAAELGSDVEVRSDSETLAHTLESMVNEIVRKVSNRFSYGPMDGKAAEVLTAVAEAVRWAAPLTPALHDQAVAEQKASYEAEAAR